jgi:hypothetical protein
VPSREFGLDAATAGLPLSARAQCPAATLVAFSLFAPSAPMTASAFVVLGLRFRRVERRRGPRA